MARLEVRQIGVSFGGVQALDGVDLEVEAGGVTGLIGPNGAGKTTLFNVICGLQRHDRGDVLLEGHSLRGIPPHRRARLGIARTFQRLEAFGSMTVRENILVAAEIHRRWSKERTHPRLVAAELVEEVGLAAVATKRVDTLPTGLARLAEVARALATRPRVLLLDEPSSGLDDAESEELGTLLERLASRGTALLLVEHNVELVMSVSSHVCALDSGRVIASGPPAAVRDDEAVRAAYLGGAPAGGAGIVEARDRAAAIDTAAVGASR